jgi:general secretion pathway protein B
MSFILDALRRAETERARGSVPGLEARALPLAGDDEPSRAVPTRGPWIVAGLAAGALVLGLAGWWLNRAPADTATMASTAPSATPAPPASPGTLAPPAPPAPAAPFLPPAIPASPAPTLPLPPAAPQRAATPTVPRQGAPTAVAHAAPLPGGGRVAVEPSRQPAQPPPAASVPRGATASALASPAASLASSPAGAPAASAATAATASSSATTATTAPGATDGRAVPLTQLSPQQRAELPPMAIGGAIYSESPASRFILVNGQVVREGDLAAPGVTLEHIGPRSAVIRWRGLRIEISQ